MIHLTSTCLLSGAPNSLYAALTNGPWAERGVGGENRKGKAALEYPPTTAGTIICNESSFIFPKNEKRTDDMGTSLYGQIVSEPGSYPLQPTGRPRPEIALQMAIAFSHRFPTSVARILITAVGPRILLPAGMPGSPDNGAFGFKAGRMKAGLACLIQSPRRNKSSLLRSPCMSLMRTSSKAANPVLVWKSTLVKLRWGNVVVVLRAAQNSL